MTNTISIVSAKGGVGKTTIALNLAVALAEKGRSTLLMDLDPQGSVGLALARPDAEWRGLAEVLLGKATAVETIIRTKLPGLSLLPRGKLHPADICDYERALYSSNNALQKVFDELGRKFHFVIMDTPSGLGMITRGALEMSSHVLLPLQAEPLALRGVSQVFRVIEKVQQDENPQLKLLGILPTMVQLDQDASFNVIRVLWSGFGGVLETFIPRADVFIKASEEGLPLGFLAGPTPPDAKRFEMLASEIEGIIAEMNGDDTKSDEKERRELL